MQYRMLVNVTYEYKSIQAEDEQVARSKVYYKVWDMLKTDTDDLYECRPPTIKSLTMEVLDTSEDIYDF